MQFSKKQVMLAEVTLALKPQPFEKADGRFVARIDICCYPVKIHDLESKLKQDWQHLRHVAMPPVDTGHGVAKFGSPVLGIELGQCASAD